ncbi:MULTISPECIES: zinc-binding dehydrogenase [Streptomyces]|uniref:alcohol dehydrogenase n=2 Tax=Streptomyces violaceusniger group TaxID=2839105 RepID=A0ABD5JGE4_9ACTN|nr:MULTISPECIES: zinc-binding dehydrogenase [Streptomyces]KUL46591.1 alcohol dehydrogenase [Streptomyces violaceusniger]MEE4586662.1 zinc-binding dehydrogenase [Streptomyces sp. DSM 41602]RSS47817.1 alcohol dehydrogenase [Streptomyces sp. WAC05858]
MRAWQFTEVGKPLTMSEVTAPAPAADELVVHVRAAGLCHSDVGFLDGTLTPLLPFRPITLGHEIAGIVSAVGPDVTEFSVGQKVVIPAAIEGPGTSLNGGFADEVAVPERLVVALPDGVPFDQAAAATDAGLTSYHAVSVQGRVSPGARVGIIGLGGLGSLGAQTALALGARLFVAEKNERVHDFARSLGAESIANDITDFAGEELDVVIDFAGFGTTTDGAIHSVRRGGRIVQVGLGRARGEIDLQALTLNEVELVGSQAGTKEDCVAVLDLVAEGRLSSRITEIGFEEIADGIGRLERGDVIGRLVASFG